MNAWKNLGKLCWSCLKVYTVVDGPGKHADNTFMPPECLELFKAPRRRWSQREIHIPFQYWTKFISLKQISNQQQSNYNQQTNFLENERETWMETWNVETLETWKRKSAPDLQLPNRSIELARRDRRIAICYFLRFLGVFAQKFWRHRTPRHQKPLLWWFFQFSIKI